jgi:hypothetical protein
MFMSKLHIITLALGVIGFAGCSSTFETTCAVDPLPDLTGIILHEVKFQTNNFAEIVSILSEEIHEQHPNRLPVRFQLAADKSRKKGEWTPIAPGYGVLIPDKRGDKQSPSLATGGDTDAITAPKNTGPSITFSASGCSLLFTLNFLESCEVIEWWSKGNTIVIDSGDPIYQSPFKAYEDPQVQAVLSNVFATLISNPGARRMADDYACGFNAKQTTQRIRPETNSLPRGFVMPMGLLHTLPSTDGDLVSGDLYVSVHRYLVKGQHARKVVLFVTGRNVMGGGWCTFLVTQTAAGWQTEYKGCFDP